MPRLRADRRASIAIVAALSLLGLVGAGALAIDLAQLYLARSSGQRIADQSALAAALAYSQSSSSVATAQNAASSLAVSNGAGASTVTTQIVASPSGDGNKAAFVTVVTPVSLTPLGQVLTSSAGTPGGVITVNVGATAYAEITNNVSPCIITTGAGGVAATGGTNLTATGCAVASAGNVAASNGANITAQAIYAVGSVSPSSCGGTGACVQTSPGGGQIFTGSSAPSDPLSTANVFSRLPTVAAMTAASFPSVGSAPAGGSAYTCSGSATISSGAIGTISTSYYPTCSSISFSGGAETDIGGNGLYLDGPGTTVNFAAGIYKINGITAPSSTSVTFNLAAGVTLYIWNGIANKGSSSMTFNGPGAYYIQGGISNSSSNAITFNNSSSTATSTFYVAGGIAISNGSGSFPNGRYSISSGDGTAGIDVAGGEKATFGNGSFNIANGISVGGGGTLTFGSQLDGNSVFQIPTDTSGGYAITTGGGSTLTLGSFPNFDLNGPVQLQGSASLGSGTYTINGALNAASAGGCCITGTSVSLITSGAISFGAGYSTISLSAPTTISNTTQSFATTVVLASDSAAASTVTAGASNTSVVGALYLPNAALQLSGAGNLTGGGGCLEVVASGISFTGGSAVSTTCSSLGSASSAATIALVQ